MVCVVHREVLDTAGLIVSADETLTRVVGNPVAEAFTLLVQFARVKVVALELAEEDKALLEVRRADAGTGIGEVVLEVAEHLTALLAGVQDKAR